MSQQHFALNGQIENRSSPAARAWILSSRDKGRQGSLVQFQNFQAGRAEKIPAA
jgi:hypothetical protein